MSSQHYNRKERKLIANKTNAKGVNWRAVKNERKAQKEHEFLESLEATGSVKVVKLDTKSENKEVKKETPLIGNQKKWYSISIAVPGSILNNTQSPELRSYVAGEIARTCAIFCVDEVVIFDETAMMTDAHLEAYYSGTWEGRAEIPSESNIECNFYLAKIMEYLDCPQYLRKALFPMQRPLKYAGLLNPLDAMHHLRADNFEVPFREGIILGRCFKKVAGSTCDVGLDQDLHLPANTVLPAGTRVTIEITSSAEDDQLEGKLTNSRSIRNKSGIYWGYKIRIAKSLSNIFSKHAYDMVVGTSERGTPIDELPIEFKKNCNLLIVFGGLAGLEAAVEADEEIKETNPGNYFEYYINSLVDQGSRIIRTEEAIPITLAALKYKLNAIA